MTLTSPGCPFGPMILSTVHEVVALIPGVENVQVELVWEPPWNPAAMASDEVKDILGIW
jgi:metal-sulfur cluster biosynthetic enzyme